MPLRLEELLQHRPVRVARPDQSLRLGLSPDLGELPLEVLVFGREVSDSTEVLLCLFVLADAHEESRRLRERETTELSVNTSPARRAIRVRTSGMKNIATPRRAAGKSWTAIGNCLRFEKGRVIASSVRIATNIEEGPPPHH